MKRGYLCQEGRRVYLNRILEYENSAARALSEILSDNTLPSTILPENFSTGSITLTPEQTNAISMALSHRLSIILGGAGTGKTSLIKALVERRPRTPPGWLLCAPTGKASCNLTARTGLEARTVHSALHRDADNEFLLDVEWNYTGLVVIDEASMLTLGMLAGILSAVCKRCRVVLVGDPNQLLSVGAGNVLADLLKLGIPCVHLKEYHRQDNVSSALAYNIQNFPSCRHTEDLHFDDSFQFIPTENDAQTLQLVRQFGGERYLRREKVQVLTPYNRSSLLSAASLNRQLQALVNPATTPKPFPDSLMPPPLPFRHLDRVIVTQNDWHQHVCNGDIGVYLTQPYIDELLALGFTAPDGRSAVWVGANSLHRLALAYAITVHKSQGSEYNSVIFALSKHLSPLLHRNLLYTTISRAKQKVILIGSLETLNAALQKEPVARNSMLLSKVHMLQQHIA